MVKVGNSECEFLKLTPLSRTSAIAGAVSGVTIRAAQAVRDEQDEVMRRIVLRRCGVRKKRGQTGGQQQDCAAHQNLPISSKIRARTLPLFSFAVRQNCYVRPDGLQCSTIGTGSRRCHGARQEHAMKRLGLVRGGFGNPRRRGRQRGNNRARISSRRGLPNAPVRPVCNSGAHSRADPWLIRGGSGGYIPLPRARFAVGRNCYVRPPMPDWSGGSRPIGCKQTRTCSNEF